MSLYPVMRLALQVPDNVLVLEHALIMLLLLVGLLSIRREQRRYVPWVVLAGVALSLLTPVHTLTLAWPLIAALVLPPLLWHIALRLATARPAVTPGAVLTWLLTAFLIGLALSIAGRMPPTSGVLLGVLAASLIWQVREQATGSTDLGAFGQLTLALLLTEVDVTLHPLGPFLGSLLTGTGFGLLLGYIGVRIATRLPAGEPRNLFCLGLAYLAYLIGVMPGASGVATATMTGLVVAIYGYHVGLWPDASALPAPLNRRGVFLLMAGTLLLLGWQAHIPPTTAQITGLGLSLIAAAIGTWVGRRLAPVPGRSPRLSWQALLRKESKVFLLLLGTLLLWPQEAVLEPWPLAVALLAALLVIVILRILLNPLLELLGIELRSGVSAAEDGETL